LKKVPVFVRFVLSSVFASGVDFVFFSGTFHFSRHLIASMAAGKVSSGIVMFLVNKHLVFESADDARKEAISFIKLVIALSILSYGIIRLLHERFGWSVYLAKAATDSTIFAANFLFQKIVVFHYRNTQSIRGA
jgi:putative flippase GtrA